MNDGDGNMPIGGPGELTLRTARSGGAIANSVRELVGSPAGSSRLVLFIHGYATDQDKACESYSRMWDRLRRAGIRSSILNSVFWVYWPGDLSIPGVSQASYAGQVRKAIDSAAKLAKYLLEIQSSVSKPIELTIVAHSLGSRLTLELISDLQVTPLQRAPHVAALALMAAAVPVEHTHGDGARLPRLATTGREVVLYSLRDKVLRWGFPTGQSKATLIGNDTGWFPEAVGRRGAPTSRWSQRVWTDYSHGEYWKGNFSAEKIAGLLGKTTEQRLAEGPTEDVALAESSLPEQSLRSFDTENLCYRQGSVSYLW